LEEGGRLTPGGKFSVTGGCFGERPGRVDLIGQFPGGKLIVPFTGWDTSNVELDMPANIRGAGDHAVALTVVTAEGRTTPAMQGRRILSRRASASKFRIGFGRLPRLLNCRTHRKPMTATSRPTVPGSGRQANQCPSTRNALSTIWWRSSCRAVLLASMAGSWDRPMKAP